MFPAALPACHARAARNSRALCRFDIKREIIESARLFFFQYVSFALPSLHLVPSFFRRDWLLLLGSVCWSVTSSHIHSRLYPWLGLLVYPSSLSFYCSFVVLSAGCNDSSACVVWASWVLVDLGCTYQARSSPGYGHTRLNSRTLLNSHTAEHSHEPILTSVRASLNLNNPNGIVDPVFGLLGNAAAAAGAGQITVLL